MMDAQKIGKKLRELRGERTQEDIAKEVGVSVSALTMYETGKRIPRDEIKVRLAVLFGVSIEAIFFS